MQKLFLNMVMLPSGLYSRMGADVDQLRAILRVKLTLDDRKPITMGRPRKEKKDIKRGALINMFISLLMGLMYMMPLVFAELEGGVRQNRIFSLTIFYSMFLFILTFMLIIDFSNILFDTRDKLIILPRPINDVTIFLSRILHVFIYLFRVVIPMSLPGWIVLGLMDGWKSALLFPLPLMCLLLLTIFIVNGFYLVLLKVVKAEKFKEVINYFQIALSVLFFTFSYLMPRIVGSNTFQQTNLDHYAWVRFTPPYWLASCWVWIGYPSPIQHSSWVGVLAIIVPIIAIWVTIKWLAPQFGKSIGAIDVVEITEQSPVHKGKVRSGNYYKRLANMLNRTDEAKAGFLITWLQTSRSRSFKMRVYPMFAYVPVYFIYMLTLDRDKSFSQVWADLKDSPKHLILLYICVMVITQALNYLTVSDQYKAAWVYYATPTATPGRIMSGAFKAIWIKFFLPFWVIISVFVLYIWGAPSLIDILLAVCNMTLFAACMMRVAYRILPFSTKEQMNNAGNRFLRVIMMLAVPGLLGFGHYLAVDMAWLKCIFLMLSAILLWLVWDSYANTSWDNVRKADI
jgi:hypothetical protein